MNSSACKRKKVACQVTVCVCPTFQTVVAVGLVMGGSTTSLDVRGKVKAVESKNVKRRTYRVNMMISLDWPRERRKPFKSKEEASPDQEADAACTRYITRPCEYTTKCGTHALCQMWDSQWTSQRQPSQSHMMFYHQMAAHVNHPRTRISSRSNPHDRRPSLAEPCPASSKTKR